METENVNRPVGRWRIKAPATIVQKMVAGFLFLIVLLVSLSGLALFNLNKLNTVHGSILKEEIPLIEMADQLAEIILAEELYARRYRLLQTFDLLSLFWNRTEQFKQMMDQIINLEKNSPRIISVLAALHEQYSRLLIASFIQKKTTEPIPQDTERQIKSLQQKLIAKTKQLSNLAAISRRTKMQQTVAIGVSTYRMTAFLCLTGLIVAVGTSLLITHNISRSVRKLKRATEQIARGRFDYPLHIGSKDELSELAVSIKVMARRLHKLEAMYRDSSPLTRLPGGIAVENAIKHSLASPGQNAFCFFDIDNFKSYNDRYGYSKGNEVIQATAEIIEEAACNFGRPGDFVGHIGGDDFALITSTACFHAICTAVTRNFDNKIPFFYNEQDRQRGHITGLSRQGHKMTFPLATISIAIVTDQHGPLENTLQLGEIAAELKKHAKSITGSTFIVDQRRKIEP